jgi:hypothetical protein
MIETTGNSRILRPFSSAPGKVASIETRIELGAHQLKAFYVLTGELGALRIPPLRDSGRINRLWEHTCFEAFIGIASASAYYEFNFSPSTEWAAFAFRDYRDGVPLANNDVAPAIAVRVQDGCVELTATIRVDRLPLIPPRARLRLGLAAVIEEIDGGLSYWALEHPVDKPDFHHPDSFVLELALPEESA